MKTLLLVAASIAGLGVWYADPPIAKSSATWVRNELRISEGKIASDPARYITAPVEEGEIRRVVTATGTLNAIVNVEIGSRLSGQIAEVLVDFNDEVKKSQPLARLDQRSFEARVEEARAALEYADLNVGATTSKLERSGKSFADLVAEMVESDLAALGERSATSNF